MDMISGLREAAKRKAEEAAKLAGAQAETKADKEDESEAAASSQVATDTAE